MNAKGAGKIGPRLRHFLENAASQRQHSLILISVFVIVASDQLAYLQAKLTAAGFMMQGTIGNITTGLIPVSNITDLTEIDQIEYIELPLSFRINEI